MVPISEVNRYYISDLAHVRLVINNESNINKETSTLMHLFVGTVDNVPSVKGT